MLFQVPIGAIWAADFSTSQLVEAHWSWRDPGDHWEQPGATSAPCPPFWL